MISMQDATLVSLIVWLLWKYFRTIPIKSTLDNVPGPPAGSLMYGNLKQTMGTEATEFLQHLTDAYPGVAKLYGPLGNRMIYVFDPTAMHHVMVKEQHIYEEATWFIKANRAFFGPGLLATLGDHHRKQRKLLNPVFSTVHIRQIVPIFAGVGRRLQQAIAVRVNRTSGPVEIDILSWMGRAALELVGQAGLGCSFDSLVSDDPDEFALAVKSFEPTMVEAPMIRRLIPYFCEIGTTSFRRKVVEHIPNKAVQRLRWIFDVIHGRCLEVYETKKRALFNNNETLAQDMVEGKDLMSVLLRVNTVAEEGDKLPEEEIVAQMSTIVFAGTDTTSSALSKTLSLLAERTDVQEKLRREIIDNIHEDAELDYDVVTSLPYLDAVCRETLRLHPTVSVVHRETRADTILPLSRPITGIDGTTMHSIQVSKDTTVVVGIISANRDKALWGEDASEWKPERWLSPLPEGILEARIPGIYSHLMTFIGGSRACIGFKFAQLEMKVMLCLLLMKFTFSPSDTPVYWNHAGVLFPTTGNGKSNKASLPIRIGNYRPGQ